MRAGIHGLFHLICRQQSACADDGIGQHLADARDGIRRSDGAKGDFDGIETAGE